MNHRFLIIGCISLIFWSLLELAMFPFCGGAFLISLSFILSIIIISVNYKTKKHFLFTCCILTCFLCFGFFRPSTDAYYISFIFAVQWIISFILSSFAEFPYNHVNKISRLDILGNIVSSIPFLVVFYWCITS